MADEHKIQTDGRKDNAAQPLNAAEKKGGPERYPTVRQDDAVEDLGRGEAAPAERRLGAGGDPAEGKR